MANVSRSLTALTFVIFPLAFVIAAAPFIFFWLPPEIAFVSHELLDKHGGVNSLALWQKILGFFVTCLPAFFLLWALYSLKRLVSALKEGKWFEENSETLCRQFGSAMLWYVGAQILHRTLLVLVLTATNPPGERELTIALTNHDLIALLPAIFAMIFAHLVGLSRAQHEELKQIV